MVFIIIALIISIAGIFLKCESDKEREALSVETYEMKSETVKCTLTLVFLSDHHDKEFGEGNKQLSEIEHIKPDAVLIGGDTMNVRKDKIGLEVTDRLLAGLTKIAPVYYGNGNNEQRLTWEQEDFEGDKIGFLELMKKY